LWQILLQKSFCICDQKSPGLWRDFRVKMWGTSSPDDKLTGDMANVIEATQIGLSYGGKNYHRAILDFCNNIGTTESHEPPRRITAHWGEAELSASGLVTTESGYVGCFHSGEVCGKVDEEASAAMGGTDV
jgi:hypothetical protein